MPYLPYPDQTAFGHELRDFLDQVPQHAGFDMLSHSVSTVK